MTVDEGSRFTDAFEPMLPPGIYAAREPAVVVAPVASSMNVPPLERKRSVPVSALDGTAMLYVPSDAVATGPATVVVPAEFMTTTAAPDTGAA
jgi:hypothetical protein